MAKRKKKRLRRRRIILLLVFIFIIVFIIIKVNKKDNKTSENNDNDVVKTYLNKVVNNSDEEINEEWQNVIVSYMDLYTSSLHNLKSKDVTKLFTDKDSNEAYLTQASIDLQVYHHSLQPNDMKLKKAYYDIEYTDVKVDGDTITIDFLEDDYYDFKYLNNITSRIIDVENTFVLRNNNGKYTIDSIRIVRDNYVIFTNMLDDNFTKDEIDRLKDKYTNYIKEEVEKNKELLKEANRKKYEPSKYCDHSYNRDDAVSYSYMYADDRNSEYSDYSELGGNCANFASQAIHEGGIPMDYTGTNQWKYFGDSVNEEDMPNGRSTSWVSTYYFYEYARNNVGSGMCAETDINLFYAEGGDVIHVGYKEDINYSHTTLVSKVVKKDNKIVDILVNSNTTGLKDYPVLGYIYHNKRLIKILGYND